MTPQDLYKKSYAYAKKKHEGQVDDCGKDYFDFHVVEVHDILFEVVQFSDNKYEILAAAFLHDVIEDTDATEEELRKEFGDVITDLVMEVTHEGQKDQYGYYFPRLKSKEGIMIKLADRLSNVSRMDSWPEKRKEQYLKRTQFWKDGSDRPNQSQSS